MLFKIVNLMTIDDTMNEISKKLDGFMDTFTENGFLAGVVTLAAFVLLCLYINNHANK